MMNKLLEELLNAVSRDPGRLEKQLRKHARELKPELAAEARSMAAEAANNGQLIFAGTALEVASQVYLKLSMRYEALYSYFEYHRVLFLRASTAREYIIVWRGASDIVQKALEIQANDLAFLASVLCANCFYFAGQDDMEKEAKENFLAGALMKLVEATKYCEHADNSGYFNDFVSLVVAVLTEIEDQWPADDSGEIQAALREMAAAVERLIPIDFAADDGFEKSVNEAHTLASLSYDHGNATNASQRLDVALARAEQQAEETHDLGIWMYLAFRRYTGTRDREGSREELDHLRQSLRSRSEQFRRTFHSRGGRLWAAQELDHFLGEFLRDELKEEQLYSSDVFRAVEAVKARTLLDQMSEVNFRDFPTQELIEQAAQMERDLLRYSPDSVVENETREEKLRNSEFRLISRLSIGLNFEDDKVDRAQRTKKLEDFYRIHQAGFQDVISTAEIEDITNALQPGEALIEYCIPYHWVHASYNLLILILTPERVEAIHIDLDDVPEWEEASVISADERQPVAFSVLGNVVSGLRVAIQMGDEAKAREALEALYELIIQPVLERGLQPPEFQRWIIVPHGIFHYIPFAALSRGQGHHLIQDVALTIAPSASAWLRLQKQRPPVTSFLGCANPELSYAQLPPLPDAEKELARISKTLASLECSTFINKEATEEVLRLQAAGKSIIHLATHGDFPEQDAIDLHSILLAATEQHDGHLNAEEVRKLDLHAARLVVLSICNGGLYRTGPGDEPYGLMAALLAAGAENSIGTLWPLDDRIGRLFMTEFYRSLLQCGPAEALRQACMKFILDKALLKDWASFILVGTGRPWND